MRPASLRNWIDHGPSVSARLKAVHGVHLLILGITILILVVERFHWEQRISVDPTRLGSTQSTINAVSQGFFTTLLSMMFFLSQSVAISNTLRNTKSLLEIDSTIETWISFGSVWTSLWRLRATDRTYALKQAASLLGIVLYVLFGSALQLTATGVLGIELYATPNITQTPAGLNSIGNYIGFDDSIGSRTEPVSSSQNTADFGRKLWQASRLAMFSPGANDTLRPGIAGRIIYDTVLSNYSGYHLATVNGTGMNARCYQPSNITTTTYLLPQNSTDMSKAVLPDAKRFINGTNLDYIASVWVNVTLPPPPYWDSSIPGLTFNSKWLDNPFRNVDIGSYPSLPTRIFMQPWIFRDDPNVPYGHQQVVMLLASGPDAVVRGTDGVGRIYNVSTDLTLTDSFCTKCTNDGTCGGSNIPWECKPGPFVGSLQVIGCDFWTNQLNVNLTESGLISNATPTWNSTARAPRSWSDKEFEWEAQSSVSMDRQILTIFSPSAPGDEPTQPPGGTVSLPVQELGLSPSERLISRLFGANTLAHKPYNVSIEDFEDALEHFAASYFWSFGTTCDKAAGNSVTSPLAPDYSQDGCRYFREAESGAFTHTGRDVTLTGAEVHARLTFVKWRAVASAVLAASLCVLAIICVGAHPLDTKQPSRFSDDVSIATVEPSREPSNTSESLLLEERRDQHIPHEEIQRGGLIEVIELMEGSSLPERVHEASAHASGHKQFYQALSRVNVRYGPGRERSGPNLDEALRT